MPFPSLAARTVVPANSPKSHHGEKDSSPSPVTSKTKIPILLHLRSSDQFVFATAAVGLFTSTFVHSIIFPLAPFIINRINHGNDAALEDPSTTKSSDVETERDTGILVAIYAVGLLVGSPIFGWLGDKIRQRRVPMLLGITAAITANFVFMFATAYWMLLVARFLQGISNACVWTMSLCLIADNWPENQLGLQMGKLVGFYPLGIMTGLPIGVLYGKLGHQAPFIASMMLCGVDFFMRIVIIERCHSPPEWFPDLAEKPKKTEKALRPPQLSVTHMSMSSICADSSLEGEDDRDSETSSTTDVAVPTDAMAAAPTATGTVSKITLLQLLRRPRLLVSLHMTLVVAAVMSAFESTLSMRLATEFHFDETSCGLMLIAYMLPAIVSGAVSGWLCDRYGTKIVALVALILVTPSCICIGIPDRGTTFWPLVIILAIGGTTMSACQSPVFPEIAGVVAVENEKRKSKSAKDGLAMSYALFNAAYGTGMCVGPILAGFLYGSVGFFWLCFVLGMQFVICIPFAYAYTGAASKGLLSKKPATTSAA